MRGDEYRDQQQHGRIDKAILLQSKNGLCIAKCGKTARHSVTCGEVECIRKWLRIGTKCPGCNRFFYQETETGFCSLNCKKLHDAGDNSRKYDQ